jgi:hypothetical protein
VKPAILFIVALLGFADRSDFEAFARGGGGYSSGHSATSSGSGHVNSNSHSTPGYTRKDGTHVEGYRSTNPNGMRDDNYSTQGNVNPQTGKVGTKSGD